MSVPAFLLIRGTTLAREIIALRQPLSSPVDFPFKFATQNILAGRAEANALRSEECTNSLYVFVQR